MPKQNVAAMIIAMRDELTASRQQELKRALGFRESNPKQAAYHTGLADGKNEVARKLTDILNASSIAKGDKDYGRPERV